MVTAYILIISESGAERRVIEDLLDIDGINEAELVYGEYDVVVRVSVGDISQLTDFIIEKIRPIKSIKRTSTLIVAGD